MDTPDIIAALRGFPVPTLAEAAPAACDLSPDIRPLVPNTPMVGTAFTVRCPPGDNTAVTRAVGEAQAGDVIVIDTGGGSRTAVWGDTASTACQIKGIVGCVTNGRARDIDEISALGFPVYAIGLSLRGSTKGQRGETNVPIAIGDVLIHPGDFVCGGPDGVLVIPRDQVEAVLDKATEDRTEELSRAQRLKDGVPLSEILATSGNK
ncbi:MAG: RraA family protein [Alphaproteobacteria bacterium]|nr:RraA family protein [Alphaproteobacteria bacterium]